MFITKKALSRRTMLRGMGATLALPLLDAMVPALTTTVRTAAAPTRRFGAIFVPMGERPSHWTPTTTGVGFEFSPILKPLEPFRDAITVVSNVDRPPAGTHAVSSGTWLTGSAPKRTEAEDFVAGHIARSDHRRQDRRRHGVPVARDWDRGFHRLRRRLRRRLQLRLHEHHFMEDADDADAARDESARGVRAAVRPSGLAGAAPAPHAPEPQHPRLGAGRRQHAGARARHARQGAARRVPRSRARDRRPDPARRATDGRRVWPRRTRRSAFPKRGKSTPRSCSS